MTLPFDWSVFHQSNQQWSTDWAEVFKMAASFRVLPREFTVASFSSFGKTFHQKLLKFCLQAKALHSCGSGHQSWLVRRSWVTGMIQTDGRWTWNRPFFSISIFSSSNSPTHFIRGAYCVLPRSSKGFDTCKIGGPKLPCIL